MDAALARLRPDLRKRIPGAVGEAVDYALDGPGKRVRGVLTMVAHEAAGGKRDVAGIAAAIEVVHAYSLVHDDLPCMDDDDLRRGRATTHRRFDAATATVAGVVMVPLAVITALSASVDAGLPRAASAAIVNELMRLAGAGGMIGGQALDLDAEGHALGVAELDRLHAAKTGALFAAAARTGGLAAEASDDRVEALAAFGAALGLIFQITDDVLDVTASDAVLGKRSGRDEALHKSTYPVAVGVEQAATRAESLVQDATAALARSGVPVTRLGALATMLAQRAA